MTTSYVMSCFVYLQTGPEDTYRSFIDALHVHDVGAYIELPQIGVMGDTSSGKSSLLSAIANIQLPSNTEITTRCPTRLRMQRILDPHGQLAIIDIKWHISSGYKTGSDWTKRVHNSSEWTAITSSIMDAQKYILDRAGKHVAPDIVEVSISSDTCEDVTVIDLPGIVRTVGKDEPESIIGDVRNMINEYLVNTRCIILAIVPANVDFHNSSIIADAKQADPKTERTIPVITKPDTISEGDENAVLDLLLGKKTEIKMGFHMAKCRAQKDLNDGMSIEQGIDKEDIFFRETKPWKLQDASFFGVKSLRTKLARVQLSMIHKSVPDIIKEMKKKQHEAENLLSQLGCNLSSVEGRRNVFAHSVDLILNQIEKALTGVDTVVDEKGYTWRALIENKKTKFCEDILALKMENGYIIEVGCVVDVIRAYGTAIEGRGVVQKILDDGSFYISSENRNLHPTIYSSTSKASDNSTAIVYQPIHASRVKIPPKWLEEKVRQHRTKDLPCFVNTSLFNLIVSNLIQKGCFPICVAFVNDCYDQLQMLIGRVLAGISDNQPSFTNYCQNRLFGVLAGAYQKTQERVEVLLSAEQFPFSLNHYLFDLITKKRNEELKNAILNAIPSSMGVASTDPNTLRTSIQNVFNATESMSMDEHATRELEIILYAYGKVSAKRVIDEVPMLMEKELFDPVLELFKEALVATDAELEDILVETSERSKKRKRAVAILDSMKMAETALKDIQYY